MAKKTKKTKKNRQTTQAWNNVNGNMRLWATEHTHNKKPFTTFSTSIGKKNDDDEYENIYFDVLFKKNEAPDVDEGECWINIKKGFITLRNGNGNVYPTVMVLEYDILEDDDLPF